MSVICGVCLSIDEPLRELEEELSDYYQDLTNYTGVFTKHLCCSACKESLKDNLDFRSKCLESNRILQEWKLMKDKNTVPIGYLHKLLKQTLNKNYTKERKISKSETNKNKDIVTENVNGINCNGFDTIKIEEIKVENELVNEKVTNGDCNVSDDNEDFSEDDNMFLIDCVSSKNNDKKEEKKGSKKGKVRVYHRKGPSEYTQYEVVFDIQLFRTDDEAREEFALRRTSEPYLSAQYRCEVCYTVYKCERLLKFHMRWHEPSEFECDICYMTFASHKPHQTHKNKCHRGKFSCKLCPLITYYGAAMKAHFQKHQGKKFPCHCGRTYNHISTYLTHKRTAHASVHVCVQCARSFVSEQGLMNHTKRAHQSISDSDSSVPAQCAPCGLTFANQLVYNVHVLNTAAHKDLANTLTACSCCGLPFDDRSQLRAHKRQNHPKKKGTNDIIHCKICGASGPGRMWRRRHYLAEHPAESYADVGEAKRHLCDQCGRKFANVTLLKDHMNTHTGAKPYVCSQCGAAFHCHVQRAMHAERHKPPARACPLCRASFRSASNLAVHMRIHSGVKRHSCSVCGKAFLHRASAREHERSVHRHIRRVRRKHDTTHDIAT